VKNRTRATTVKGIEGKIIDSKLRDKENRSNLKDIKVSFLQFSPLLFTVE